MPTMYDDVNVKCPFFTASDKTRITCEGITDDCATVLRFTTQEKRNHHHINFCDERYKACEIYKMLKEKYKD